jgi:nitrogen regulatory protein PII-like uncharacterized protein
MGVIPDDSYLSELRQISFQPVFILGVHRSGTSILYKMLAATGSFNPVTAYHIIHYHELLTNHKQNTEEAARRQLTESLHAEGLQDRKIDSMEVTADLAEEYGFLLNQKTTAMYLKPKNTPLFVEMGKKLQYIAENSKPLLLKNPYDLPHFLYIKQVFPNAKFVFIHRHPVKTISSTLKAFQVIFHEYHPYMAYLWGNYEKFYRNPLVIWLFRLMFMKVPEIGVIYITRTTAKATSYYLRNIRKLSPEDYVALTYEEFCEHPQQTIEDIMRRLSIPVQTSVDAAAQMSPRNVKIDDTVQKLTPYIYRSLREYCDTFGYATEKEESSHHP